MWILNGGNSGNNEKDNLLNGGNYYEHEERHPTKRWKSFWTVGWIKIANTKRRNEDTKRWNWWKQHFNAQMWNSSPPTKRRISKLRMLNGGRRRQAHGKRLCPWRNDILTPHIERPPHINTTRSQIKIRTKTRKMNSNELKAEEFSLCF